MESVKDPTFFYTLRQCWTVPSCQNDICSYGRFVDFHWPDVLPQIDNADQFDNADPLFAVVIKPGFYLHCVEVADQDIARDSL